MVFLDGTETSQRKKLQEKSVMIVLGSGGHTAEMLMMLKPDKAKG
jgi:beta-1,4-N-acetylglucosaminyltransferase